MAKRRLAHPPLVCSSITRRCWTAWSTLHLHTMMIVLGLSYTFLNVSVSSNEKLTAQIQTLSNVIRENSILGVILNHSPQRIAG